METKIHRCSSPRVIPFNPWIPYPQIQPSLKSKHSGKFIEKKIVYKWCVFQGSSISHSPFNPFSIGGQKVYFHFVYYDDPIMNIMSLCGYIILLGRYPGMELLGHVVN